jgi:hypothetical protein
MIITVHTRFNSRTINVNRLIWKTPQGKQTGTGQDSLARVHNFRPTQTFLACVARVPGLKLKLGRSPARCASFSIWTVHPRWTVGRQYKRNKTSRSRQAARYPNPSHFASHPAAPEPVGRAEPDEGDAAASTGAGVQKLPPLGTSAATQRRRPSPPRGCFPPSPMATTLPYNTPRRKKIPRRCGAPPRRARTARTRLLREAPYRCMEIPMRWQRTSRRSSHVRVETRGGSFLGFGHYGGPFRIQQPVQNPTQPSRYGIWAFWRQFVWIWAFGS